MFHVLTTELNIPHLVKLAQQALIDLEQQPFGELVTKMEEALGVPAEPMVELVRFMHSVAAQEPIIALRDALTADGMAVLILPTQNPGWSAVFVSRRIVMLEKKKHDSAYRIGARLPYKKGEPIN